MQGSVPCTEGREVVRAAAFIVRMLHPPRPSQRDLLELTGKKIGLPAEIQRSGSQIQICQI